jgi:hypothetical protein
MARIEGAAEKGRNRAEGSKTVVAHMNPETRDELEARRSGARLYNLCFKLLTNGDWLG